MQLILNMNGSQADIDSRPSDAIALALRARTPIFVSEAVLDEAGIKLGEEPEGPTVELPEINLS